MQWENLLPANGKIIDDTHKRALAGHARRLILTGVKISTVKSELSNLCSCLEGQPSDILITLRKLPEKELEAQIAKLAKLATVGTSLAELIRHEAGDATRSAASKAQRPSNPQNIEDAQRIAAWAARTIYPEKTTAYNKNGSTYENSLAGMLNHTFWHLENSITGNVTDNPPALREHTLLPDSKWNDVVQKTTEQPTGADKRRSALRIFRVWAHVNAFVDSLPGQTERDQARAHLEDWIRYRIENGAKAQESVQGFVSLWNIPEFAGRATSDGAWDEHVTAYLAKRGADKQRPLTAHPDDIKATLTHFRQWEIARNPLPADNG